MTFIGFNAAAANTVDISGTGRLAGDLLVLSCVDSTLVLTPTAGFTLVGPETFSTIKRPTYWKISDGTETNVGVTNGSAVACSVWRGVDAISYLGGRDGITSQISLEALGETHIFYNATIHVSGTGAAAGPPAPVDTHGRTPGTGVMVMHNSEPPVDGVLTGRVWVWGGLAAAMTTMTYGLYLIPSAPTDVTVEPHVTTVLMQWTADPTAAYYEVRIDGGSAMFAGSDTSYVVSGLTASTTYDFEVRSVNGGGSSGWTLVSGVTTYASAWSEVRLDGAAEIVVGNDTDHEFTGLDAGTGHTMEVRNVTSDGPGDWASIVGITLPGTPENLTATPGETSVEVCWTEAGP